MVNQEWQTEKKFEKYVFKSTMLYNQIIFVKNKLIFASLTTRVRYIINYVPSWAFLLT